MSSALNRRDFLKLASLSLLGLAAAPRFGSLHPHTNPWPPYCGNAKYPQTLTHAQQQRLLTTSRVYIAPDPEAASQVAKDIDFVEGPVEDASTMCGPLSVAILKAAALLDPWAGVHDFWLLDPDVNRNVLEKTLPRDLYYWWHYDTLIAEFDFGRFPLHAGDLLYLYAGSPDTYEHILVVNQVDDEGRASTVSNFFTENGTIIEERVLYDPALPGAGQFYDWAKREYRNKRGMTGSGGFDIWRVKDAKTLENPGDEASQALRRALNELFLSGDGLYYALIKELDGPTNFRFNPYEHFHPASTIKVPIALAFFAWLDESTPADRETFLQENGFAGRTYSQLLEAMLVDSEELATENLVDFLGIARIEAQWDAWGVAGTRLNPRRSKAAELVRGLERLYRGNWVSPESRAQLLKLLATYSANDATRLGRLRRLLPSGARIYNKRGSLTSGPRVVADSALIEIPQAGRQLPRVYVFSLHALSKAGTSYESLESTLDQAVDFFGEFLSATI